MKNKFLEAAHKEALKAYSQGECPIGAVIVKDDKIIARGHNLRENKEDPLGHAEIIAIKKASKKLNSWRLEDCSLYVTLEPCLMCAGAIVNSRIKEVYIGAKDWRNGAVFNNCDSFNLYTHKPKAYYLECESCSSILTNFFKDLRFNISLDKIEIKTNRLLIRPFKETDLLDFYEYAKIEGVGEKAGWKHHENIETTKRVLKAFIEHKDVLAISMNGKVIGSIGIHKHYEPKFGGLKYRELGYVLSQTYQQQGIMTEALRALIPVLFAEYKLDLLICGHAKENIASQKTMLKQGFKEYKRTKKAIYYCLFNI